MSEMCKVLCSGTSYYICIKCIYIRQYHVIVSSKVVQFFLKKMHIGQISRKQNRRKKVPTKYKSANILLSFYPTAPEPSEIDFPAQFTSEIDLMCFFPIPEHPWLKTPKFCSAVRPPYVRTDYSGPPVIWARRRMPRLICC